MTQFDHPPDTVGDVQTYSNTHETRQLTLDYARRRYKNLST
jgi:hypothetical protein